MPYVRKHYTIYYNLIHKQLFQLHNCKPVCKSLCHNISSQLSYREVCLISRNLCYYKVREVLSMSLVKVSHIRMNRLRQAEPVSITCEEC